MQQTYTVKMKNSFCPNHIFDCGQCFRWKKQEDGSYTGVFKNNVLNVKKENDTITFTGICKGNIKDVVNDYFDLNTNYEAIKESLSKIDTYLAQSIEYGEGIRILKQDLWEMIISFIISANNNIPRIQKIIENISKEYGTPIVWNEKTYYAFPTKEQLSKASVEDLRRLGLGFRDKYVFDTTKRIVEDKEFLKNLNNTQDVDEARKILLSLQGVGPKVADCILLFGMHRFNVFPIDVWVRRVMNELYIKNEDETKVSKIQIEKLAKTKYADMCGIAQQYLFYWKRETA